MERSRRSLRNAAIGFSLLACFLLFVTAASWAGIGKFNPTTGKFDFIVSIQFAASDAQIDAVKARFIAASKVFHTATRGNHQFGRITICNNSMATGYADFLIFDTRCAKSRATPGGYGIRFVNEDEPKVPVYDSSPEDVMNRVKLYWDRIEDSERGHFTIAHEFSHLVYDIRDEYEGPGDVPSECPGNATACLMDSYYTRPSSGTFITDDCGRYVREIPTLIQFCDTTNHDPLKNNYQNETHSGKSCWEVVSTQTRFPLTGVKPLVGPTFLDATNERRIVILLDRSGSMLPENNIGAEDRLTAAKDAATEFINALPDTDGWGNIYQIGAVSFANTANGEVALENVTATKQTTTTTVIVNIPGGGATGMGLGIAEALSQMPADFACPEIFILLSDGQHNHGVHPDSLIHEMLSRGVIVYTIGIGSEADRTILKALADTTGGMYIPVNVSEMPIPFTSKHLLTAAPAQDFPRENEATIRLRLALQRAFTELFRIVEGGGYIVNKFDNMKAKL